MTLEFSLSTYIGKPLTLWVPFSCSMLNRDFQAIETAALP